MSDDAPPIPPTPSAPAAKTPAAKTPAAKTPAAKTPAAKTPAAKNMDRWLGDGGMAIIDAIGGAFEAYGADGEGWVSGRWVPTPLACNPHGIVQAGVHGVILDAAMNFAANAGLPGRDRTRATLEMKTETVRVANAGDQLRVRGQTTRQAKQVAYVEATVHNGGGQLVSRSTGTFLLHREQE